MELQSTYRITISKISKSQKRPNIISMLCEYKTVKYHTIDIFYLVT